LLMIRLTCVFAICGEITNFSAGSCLESPRPTSSKTSRSRSVSKAKLFDTTTHSIDITFDQAEYEEMLSTFREDGEKEYIRADITIDGTLIEDVGLRLKGNSTMQSLSNNSMGGGMTQPFEDNPEELPWLISFDEYEEGRAYQGMTEIALRPAASGSEVAINEALALELTAESGQITQDYTFTSVTVNGSESAARIVVDAPDTELADELGSGVLYKARAGGSLDYVGDDPTEYEDSFKQINAEGAYDLQP